MTSDQVVQFATFLGTLPARFSNPDLDLATVRDIVETMHPATNEPEGVSYAEEDAGGGGALRCIPADDDPEAVLLPMFGDIFPTPAWPMPTTMKISAQYQVTDVIRQCV